MSTAPTLVGVPINATRSMLGECPLWCERTQSLWWTDIDGFKLHRWHAESGEARYWPMPDRVGSFALTEDADVLLLGFVAEMALYDLRQQRKLHRVGVDRPDTGIRINDGRCDAQGRFVFGFYGPSGTKPGAFHRVDRHMRVEKLPLPPAEVANSIAFSPDGSRMYFADSARQKIWVSDYAEDGMVGGPRLLVSYTDGFPDGSEVDADGGLWNAVYAGRRVVRLDATGRETHRLTLGAGRPTCPAFGGPGLRTLFVTSAYQEMSDERRVAEPLAGATLQMPAPVAGLPVRRFQVA
jgi:L-arabinonolactonase